MDVAKRSFDELRQPATVAQLHLDMGLIFGNRRIAGGRRRFANALDRRIVDRLVGVLAETALAAHQSNGGAVIDREFSLQTLRNVLLITQIQYEGRDAKANRHDRRRIRSMLVVNLDCAIDGGMVDDAARKRLVSVLAKVEIDAEPSGDLREVARRRKHVRKAS